MKFVSELSNEKLVCSELKVRDYKDLLKCLYGDDPDKVVFVETICDVLSKLTTKSPEYFKNLNIIDLFCLVLDTRMNSLGDSCSVTITINDKKMNLELRLNYIRDEVNQIFKLVSDTIAQDSVEISLQYPSAERLLQPSPEPYLSFIKGFSVNNSDTKKSAEVTTNEQSGILFEKISPKTSMQIVERVNCYINTLSEINFLTRYRIKDQELTFSPSLDSLIWFTKLIFSETLETLYDNLFYLAHLGNMGPEYIENAVVGEYNYFVNCLKQTISDKNPPPDSTDRFISDEEAGFTDS